MLYNTYNIYSTVLRYECRTVEVKRHSKYGVYSTENVRSTYMAQKPTAVRSSIASALQACLVAYKAAGQRRTGQGRTTAAVGETRRTVQYSTYDCIKNSSNARSSARGLSSGTQRSTLRMNLRKTARSSSLSQRSRISKVWSGMGIEPFQFPVTGCQLVHDSDQTVRSTPLMEVIHHRHP